MDDLDTSTDAVKLSTAERNDGPSSDNRPSYDHDDDDDLWYDDTVSYNNNSNVASDLASELDREWRKTGNQLHTIGYREGLAAGKEASTQEGFNGGFKQSVLSGYKWGLVRGVTSALSCLPIGLNEKLAGPVEAKDKLQNLHENVCDISTKDAFHFFCDKVLTTELSNQSEDFEGNSNIFGEKSTIPSSNQMGRYIQEFEQLMECSVIRLHKIE